MNALLALALLLAAPPSPSGTFAAEWAATRAREFEAAVDPLAAGPTGPLYRERPSNQAVVKDFTPPRSLAPLIRAVSPAVVNISAVGSEPGAGNARSLGSGFILSPDGYVVTNDHVVADAAEIRVKINDGREFTAVVVGKDGSVDLALLHLVGDLKDLPFVYLGDSDQLEVGDWVVAIGSPFGLDHSVSHGMISARERVLGVGAFDDFIQTDALINPGNSGGPLFGMDGEVIGVNTAILTRGQGIGFAVPINLVKDLLPNLKVNGHLARGWMGLTVNERPDGKGAVVEGVYAGSPAAEGGVHPGDRITLLNGKPVESYLQLLRKIALLPPGSRTRFTLVRNGQTREAEIILAQRPAPETLQTLATLQEIEPAGLAVQPVTPTLAARLMLPVESGLWVAGVVPGSAADRAGLREGDVIDRANDQDVNDVQGFRDVVGHRTGHELRLHFLRGAEPRTLVVGD